MDAGKPLVPSKKYQVCYGLFLGVPCSSCVSNSTPCLIVVLLRSLLATILPMLFLPASPPYPPPLPAAASAPAGRTWHKVGKEASGQDLRPLPARAASLWILSGFGPRTGGALAPPRAPRGTKPWQTSPERWTSRRTKWPSSQPVIRGTLGSIWCWCIKWRRVGPSGSASPRTSALRSLT